MGLYSTSVGAVSKDARLAGCDYLQEVRGCAQGTICAHKRIAKCFLTYLEKKRRQLQALTGGDLEEYIKKAGKRLSRGSLQNEAGGLRSFLRFLASQKRIQSGLDSQIDTPRLYRLEHLPRSLPWETVRAFLQSIDRTTDMGLRDYTIFLLIATYGLRVSEAVALTLEGIQWRANTIKVFQPKASWNRTAQISEARSASPALPTDFSTNEGADRSPHAGRREEGISVLVPPERFRDSFSRSALHATRICSKSAEKRHRA
ncbi:MAG: hypothetical protein DMG41_38320 [Acidobacteria bacterium]|nr:MAG: hypothetical protein DMG41_38320 [Acidobacteriota bacterium]